jgi:uncharacterized protein (TIGR02145 family)
MKDAAGNRYTTVTIGNQVWMAENLRALFINKPNNTYSSDVINAIFWYPDNDIRTMSTYDLLYSFNGARELLPGGGWRIPTLQDIDRLLSALGTDYNNGTSAVVRALNINEYPGSNDLEIITIDKYFSLLLDEPASNIEYEYSTIRIHSRDFIDSELYRRKLYIYNATRDFASSVRFVKDLK